MVLGGSNSRETEREGERERERCTKALWGQSPKLIPVTMLEALLKHHQGLFSCLLFLYVAQNMRFVIF